MAEEWFTVDSAVLTDCEDRLYCVEVDSPDHQFLAGEMGVPTHNTDEGKDEDGKKGECSMILGSLLRLGRAAGVFLVTATQRPDASILGGGERKANMHVRICAGPVNSTASSMILDNGEGTRINGGVKGRVFVQTHGKKVGHGQGFFQPQKWLDEFLEKQGLNPDGSKVGEEPKQAISAEDGNAVSGDIGQITLDGKATDDFGRPEEDWDNDLDDLVSLNYDEGDN